jgi:serine/threonine-protein kinase
MRGSDGFRKVVAVKMMRAHEMPEEDLRRFRDEARILGLVRDRAIVSVDPPTRLAGRLAVVMEYIEGCSAATLVRQGAVPVSVALEITQEIARVLDKVARLSGPDGRPLNLLHRDLKPGNIQITPGGEVKILDFGIARATFDAREALTTANVSGTLGYMAPERLSGVEVPAGDIYSLGVVLRVMITRDKAVTHGVFVPRGRPVDRTAAVEAALALSAEMCALDPAERPTARAVEDRCQALRLEAPGLTLRAWAETHVAASAELQADDLVGEMLSETLAAVVPGPAAPRRWRRFVLPAALATMLLGGALSFGAASQRLPVTQSPAAPALPAVASAAAPALAPVAASPVVAAPAHVAPVPARVSVPNTAPVARAPPDAVALPVEPAAAVAEAPVPSLGIAVTADRAPAASASARYAHWPVTFASVPGGADVRIDGVSIGAAPIIDYPLSIGSFTVTMSYPTGEVTTQTIQTGGRAPHRYVWDRRGGDTWNSY